jgi:hypothetical protein
MNRIARVVLLSLIAMMQVLTLVGGFIAYEQMSGAMWKLQMDYKALYEETHDLIIDYGLIPSPFSPLIPLILLGLFSTAVLLIDQLADKNQR